MRSLRRHAAWNELNYPHFITAVTKDRVKLFADENCAKSLIDQWRFYSHRYDIEFIAGVVMSDHFHVIIWPKGDRTCSDFMHGVKGYFARWYGKEIGNTERDREQERGVGAPPIVEGAEIGAVLQKGYTPKIWQDSYFDFVIPDEDKLNEKVLYILENPVEDNLVADWRDYPHILVNEEYKPD